MYTCRTLYNAGIQPLVRLHFSITERNIHSFYDFMLAHSPGSFLALHWCDLRKYQVTHRSGIPLAVELLQRAVNIRALYLPYGIMSEDNSVAQAVSSLTRLEDLSIYGPANGATDYVLANLQSPIAEICIFFAEEDARDVVLPFRNFRTTLEQMTLSNVRFSSMEFTYPRIVFLELQNCDRPPLSILATAFPNVETLVLETKEYRWEEIEDTEQLEDLRNQNLAYQEGRMCWTSLRAVTADLVALYAMGLKNPLQFLEIELMLELLPTHVELLRAVISTIETKTLLLALPGTPSTPSALSELFRDGSAAPLVLLKLILLFDLQLDPEESLVSGCVITVNQRND